MKKLIPNLKEALKSGYRYYFYLWFLAVLILYFSIFFFIKELKYFFALQESQKKLNESFQRLQPQVVKIKERLKAIDWSKDFSKKKISVTLTLDLGNLPKTIKDLQKLTKEQDRYFLLEKMIFKQDKDKPLVLLLQGEIIKFNQ